jgi:hypothetical protein
MTDHTVEGVTGVYPSEPAVTCSWFTLRSAGCAAKACSPAAIRPQVDSAGRMTTNPSTTSPFWPGD